MSLCVYFVVCSTLCALEWAGLFLCTFSLEHCRMCLCSPFNPSILVPYHPSETCWISLVYWVPFKYPITLKLLFLCVCVWCFFWSSAHFSPDLVVLCENLPPSSCPWLVCGSLTCSLNSWCLFCSLKQGCGVAVWYFHLHRGISTVLLLIGHSNKLSGLFPSFHGSCCLLPVAPQPENRSHLCGDIGWGNLDFVVWLCLELFKQNLAALDF